jgi:peptidoglycan/LPS O-acetylase OafA/YrhL
VLIFFFVISGYLITSILIREIGEERFSLIAFYGRRARRILPALYTVMLVTYLVGLVILSPRELAALSASI